MVGIVALVAPGTASAITSDQMSGVPLLDNLRRNDPAPTFSASGMGAGKWGTPTAYATDRGGAYEGIGYASVSGFSAAYWKEELKDGGNGVAVSARLTQDLKPGRTVALMLNQPSPTTKLSGYELAVEGTLGLPSIYLIKWTEGISKQLAFLSGGIGTGTPSYGLAEKNGQITAWIRTAEVPWVQFLEEKEDKTPFKSGYAGLIIAGSEVSLDSFSAGPLRAATPQVTATAPTSPGASTTPKVSGTAEVGATVKIFTNSSCSGSPAAFGSAAAFASPGISVTVAEGATTTFYANATNSESLTSPCSSTSATYTQDSKPPAAPTFNWTQPASPAEKTSPKVGGSAESGSTVKLYTNSSCTSALAATGSASTFASPGIATTVGNNTATTYWATATDAAGNTSACSSSSQKYVNAKSEIYWEGASLSDFEELLQCEGTGRIGEGPDPLGSGKTVMLFSPLDTDGALPGEKPGEHCLVNGGTAPSVNPRATAVSPKFISDGLEFWMRTKLLISPEFDEFPPGGWMTMTSVYGYPYGPYESPWRTELQADRDRTGTFEGDRFMHGFNGNNLQGNAYKIPWWKNESPYGQWHEILIHEKFSKEGFIEEWFDGSQETFWGKNSYYSYPGVPETTKLQFETMDASNGLEANSVRIGQYRNAESFTPAPVYYEFVKVGKTKASVGG